MQANWQLVVFKLSGCLVCEVLSERLTTHLHTFEEHGIKFTAVVDLQSTEPHLSGIRPRLFPSIIAFRDAVPVAGWEGFAVMEPEDIKEIIVHQFVAKVIDMVKKDEATEQDTADASTAET